MIRYLLLVFLFNLSFSQSRKTADYIIYGAQIIKDIVRPNNTNNKQLEQDIRDKYNLPASQSKNNPDRLSEENEGNSFCFENRYENRMKLELRRKMKSGEYGQNLEYLVIQPNQMECSLGLSDGIYHYKISETKDNITDIILKEGDLKIEKEDVKRKLE